MTTQTPARRGLLFITLAGVLWGTTGVVVHWVNAATGMDALTIGFWRLLVSAVVMLLFSVRTLPVLMDAVRRFPVKVPLAGVGLAAYQGCTSCPCCGPASPLPPWSVSASHPC